MHLTRPHFSTNCMFGSDRSFLCQNVLLTRRDWRDEDIVTFQTEQLTMMTPSETLKLFFCTRSHCRSLQPWWRVRASLVHCVGFYAPYMLCFGQGLGGWLTHTYIYIYIWVTLLVKARLIHSIYCRSSYQFLTLLWMWLCSPQACKKRRCLV